MAHQARYERRYPGGPAMNRSTPAADRDIRSELIAMALVVGLLIGYVCGLRTAEAPVLIQGMARVEHLDRGELLWDLSGIYAGQHSRQEWIHRVCTINGWGGTVSTSAADRPFVVEDWTKLPCRR